MLLLVFGFFQVPFQEAAEVTAAAEAAAQKAAAPLQVKNVSEEDAGDLANGRCAICNESFEKFWDKEAEEFMIKDAIMVDDKVLMMETVNIVSFPHLHTHFPSIHLLQLFHYSCKSPQKSLKVPTSSENGAASPIMKKRKIEK
jgi:hypothetical protein